jgi:hypothetical protein
MSHAQRPLFCQVKIGTRNLLRRRVGDMAPRPLAQGPGRGQVIGVKVRFHGAGQAKAERAENSQVALDRREDRIDQDRL